jgi:hypothetical protein
MTTPANSTLWRVGLRAGMVAAVVNLSLYRFGMNWDIFPKVVILPTPTSEFSLLPLVLASVGAALAGTLIYTLLARHMRQPLIALYGITLGVVMLSSFGPGTMRTWTDRQVYYINLMHVVVAVSTLVALWHWERTRRTSIRRHDHDDSNSRTRLGE